MASFPRIAAIASVMLASVVLSLPASATTYLFKFENDSTSANYGVYGDVVITGQFTTANVALPTAITGISGSVAGGTVLDGTITGLSPYAASDNILYNTGTTGDYSFGGVSFTVSDGVSSADYNLYDWNGSTFLLFSRVDSVGYPQNGTPAGSPNPAVTPSIVTPVPEPAIWAMLLLGFGAVGFMLRASRRKQYDLTAAA